MNIEQQKLVKELVNKEISRLKDLSQQWPSNDIRELLTEKIERYTRVLDVLEPRISIYDR